LNKEDQTIKQIRALISEGRGAEALALISREAKTSDTLHRLRQWQNLSGELLNRPDRPHIKIALVGQATLNYVAEALKFHLALLHIHSEIHLCFGALANHALDPESTLHAFAPDIIWNFSTAYDLPVHPTKETMDELLREWRNAWEVLLSKKIQIVQNNLDTDSIQALGHFERALPFSRRNLTEYFNAKLIQERSPGVTIFDYDWLASLYGRHQWFDRRFWFQAKYPFAPDATALVTHHGARVITAMLGRSRKCLVLDLDNTLWGGTLADDGLEAIEIGPGTPRGEAHAHFQHYLLELKNRGVVLALCSKNDETMVREAFLKRSDMPLRLDDFAAIAINWENKAKNLITIATQLRLGPDALVFVDDNPFERNLVREMLPSVAVPEMPDDVSDYSQTLNGHGYFEAVDFSDEDRRRHQLYDENRQRDELRKGARSFEDYLRGLEMDCRANDLDSQNAARAVQLINKSNQFNLTAEKVNAATIAASTGRIYTLRDRIGDYGLISVVLFSIEGETLNIQNWVMSCRALGRKVEESVFQDLCQVARAKKAKRIIGHYRATEKNGLVAELYTKFGFTLLESFASHRRWELALTANSPQM